MVFLDPCYIRDFFIFVDTGVHILAIVALRSVWHWILDWTMFSELRLKNSYSFDFMKSLRNGIEHAEVDDLNKL